MKSEAKILTAFILNLLFSLFELVGGVITGSVAISSDAMHDFGDALSIGISFFMEKISKRGPDDRYTYGYGRYSIIGALITTLILLAGSLMMIYTAALRIISPRDIDSDGMIIMAAIGVCVNLCAAIFTGGDGSLNQKAVNLHMLEDVFGWLAVLVGAVLMYFTSLSVIDPLLSIGVSIYIIIGSLDNLKRIMVPILEKVPTGIDLKAVKDHLVRLEGVLDVHHIHIWNIDEENRIATMHVVYDGDAHDIKDAVRCKLLDFGIGHVTLELESSKDLCHSIVCNVKSEAHHAHCHHH